MPYQECEDKRADWAYQDSVFRGEYAHAATIEGGNMKKLLALIALASCLAVPSFAGDVVGHSVKVAAKDSAKAVTVTAKDTAKASVKVVKFSDRN